MTLLDNRAACWIDGIWLI